MPVPITPAEQASPLFPFLERDILPVPMNIAQKIYAGDFDLDAALHPSDMNRLFEDGYLPGEFGYWHLSDGGAVVANLVPMPHVTPEMFDWWFAWHGLNSMRYKIWNKDEHYYCQTRNPEKALDDSLSMKERYWNTVHDIREAMLSDQRPADLHPNFVPPETVGYDPQLLKGFKGTIVCTSGSPIMSHFVRPAAEGCELRTRFWFGYIAKDNQAIRAEVPIPPEERLQALLMHNVKEFTHLAEILPELYALYKDDFRVPPIS